jgi:hypothetical protein
MVKTICVEKKLIIVLSEGAKPADTPELAKVSVLVFLCR